MSPKGTRRGTGPANEFSNAINEQIRLLMARRRYTQSELSERTGISKNRISKTISLGEAPLNTNELDLICQALEVDIFSIIRVAEQQAAQSQEPKLSVDPASLTEDDLREDYDLAADQHSDGDEVDYESYN